MKKLISLLLSFVLLASLSIPAFADNPLAEELYSVTTGTNDPSRLEETVWYYRTTDTGLFQKRLWSLTYGYWLTDWITIGTVNP